mgnify:FL=1
MALALVFLGWLCMFFYGIVLLRASNNYKLKAALISLFFASISFVLMFSLYAWMFFDLSPIDMQRIGCGLNATHYSECYPEGYFPK